MRHGTDTANLPAVIAPFRKQLPDLDRSKVDLIKRMVCPRDTTDDELALFIHECVRRGCHPLDRLIVMTKFKSDDDEDQGKKVVLMTTIDYLRAQAGESATFAGCDRPTFTGEIVIDGGKKAPAEATVAVYKMVGSTRVKIAEGVARWNEFYPGPSKRGAMWRKFPSIMLGKCAEAQALRKAFPQKLRRLYAQEELAQGFAADEARSVGRGRSRGADVPEPVPPPPPDSVRDITDPEAASTPPAERWTVSGFRKGKSKAQPGKDVWEVTCENGEGATAKYYTLEPEMFAALQRFQEHRTVLAITAEQKDGFQEIVDVLPIND